VYSESKGIWILHNIEGHWIEFSIINLVIYLLKKHLSATTTSYW